MSDPSGDYYSRLGPVRSLSKAEHAIVTKLVCRSPHAKKLLGQLRRAQVRDMPDGGMGSIHFCSGSSGSGRRDAGEQIAEGAFTDADGTPVSVTLDLDDRGELYELDVFKADGSQLIRYPEAEDLQIIERHGELGVPPSKPPQAR